VLISTVYRGPAPFEEYIETSLSRVKILTRAEYAETFDCPEQRRWAMEL